MFSKKKFNFTIGLLSKSSFASLLSELWQFWWNNWQFYKTKMPDKVTLNFSKILIAENREKVSDYKWNIYCHIAKYSGQTCNLIVSLWKSSKVVHKDKETIVMAAPWFSNFNKGKKKLIFTEGQCTI